MVSAKTHYRLITISPVDRHRAALLVRVQEPIRDFRRSDVSFGAYCWGQRPSVGKRVRINGNSLPPKLVPTFGPSVTAAIWMI